MDLLIGRRQHLLGLATAVLIYAVLVHFGSRRWLAALATVPVLFDPLQLDIEQYILTDVSATFLVVVALVVLVWKREAVGKAAPALCQRVLTRAYHNGLILLSCGVSTVRFIPPLMVSRADVDEALSLLRIALREALAAG